MLFRSLSTSEDKAGRSAKCPGCGERVTVPQPGAQSSAPSIEEDWEVPPEEPRPSLSRQSTRSRSATVRSEDADQERQPCPMCGELIRAAAVKCRYCGELLEDTLNEGASPGDELTAGAIFDNAWRVFQNHAGLLIGSWVLSTFIQFVFYLGMVLLITLLTQGQPQGGNAEAMVAMVIFPGMLVLTLLVLFLNLGLLRLNLNVARGHEASVADLFSGGSYLLPALGAALVFFPIYALGFEIGRAHV